MRYYFFCRDSLALRELGQKVRGQRAEQMALSQKTGVCSTGAELERCPRSFSETYAAVAGDTGRSLGNRFGIRVGNGDSFLHELDEGKGSHAHRFNFDHLDRSWM